MKLPSGLFLFPFKTRLQVFLLITGVSLVVYFNTLGHQMAYDDEQVIRKNEFVLRGIKGIPDILTHDSHFCFYKATGLKNILPGGRYRPLSVVSFAVEQQLFATKHDSVPLQFIWDLNGNGRVEPEEDYNGDHILTDDDFFARGLGFRHLVNVLLFAGIVGLIYIFSTVHLPGFSADVVFVSCLLFAVLPVHTEVIANIKSRDELFSMFFILLTLFFAFRFFKHGNRWDIISFNFSFFFALLSKEFAMVLPLLIPILLFVFLPKFPEVKIKKIVPAVSTLFSAILLPFVFHFPIYFIFLTFLILIIFSGRFKLDKLPAFFYSLAIPVFIYLVLRLNATSDVGNYDLFKGNIISNPYLPATVSQEWATKIYILFKYIIISIIPVKLSCDYSYSSIAFLDFSNWQVWLSIVVYFSLIVTSLILFFKRHVLVFPLFIFLAFLLPISNFFIDLGATMGERLIFHSSLGLCFLLAFPLNFIKPNFILKMRFISHLITVFILIIVSVYSTFTIMRNRVWENNFYLFSEDVKTYPKNIMLLSGISSALGEKAAQVFDPEMKKKLALQSINFVDRGLQQSGSYLPLYQTLALDYYLLKQYDYSIKACKGGLKIDKTNVTLQNFLKVISKERVVAGVEMFKRKQLDSAIIAFDFAIKANASNPDAWYNKAYTLKSQGDTSEAVDVLKKGIQIKKTKSLDKLLQELD